MEKINQVRELFIFFSATICYFLNTHFVIIFVKIFLYVTFTRFLAECWGDRTVSNALSTFPVRLRDFSKCVKQDWSFCQEGALRCIGNSDGIAVYQII